jgi:PTH2 family peptidyl-tRNA hydrolase
MNPNENPPKSNEALKKEIMEFGFDEEKIDLAMKLSSDKEEICNIIVRMIEEPEFFNQMKTNTQLNQNQNNNNNNSLFTNFSNILQNLSHPQEYKMVIVVRNDLKMSIGKTAAQVGHAVLGAYQRSMNKNALLVNNWQNFSGQAKIVLQVNSEKELNDIEDNAKKNGLVTCLIRDAGRTEVEPNTPTCCAIGPDIVSNIDKITGNLKLL